MADEEGKICDTPASEDHVKEEDAKEVTEEDSERSEEEYLAYDREHSTTDESGILFSAHHNVCNN